MNRYPVNSQHYPGSNRENDGVVPYHFTPFHAAPIQRRGAIDLTASGAVRSDYWHRGMPSRVVTRNHDEHPGIFFFPDDGVGHGVAMSECEYGRGMLNPDVPCMRVLPPEFRDVTSGNMIITWPGYQTLKWKHKILFVDKEGFPLTIRQMGLQVARLWRDFYEKHHQQFDGTIPGIRLGPNDVTMNHIRLHGVYSHNYGRLWQVEVSYICPKC